MRKVFVTSSLPESALSRLVTRAEVVAFRRGDAGAGGAGVAEGPTRTELIRGASGCFGVLCSARDVVDAAVLDATGVRIVANCGEGVEHIDLEAARARRVWVTNTPGVATEAVADLTMGLMLALTRRVVAADRWVRAGCAAEGMSGAVAQPKPDFCGVELRQRTLGIIGLGRVGRAVARRAGAFGMRVLFCGGRADGVAAEARDLGGLLRESDVVSIHCTLGAATLGLIAARELALMKPGSFIVNAGRGPVVDGDALYEALRSGRIAGAALDAHGGPGDRVDARLAALDNVVLTPRIGAATQETRLTMAERAVDNLLAALSGAVPADCVV